MRRVNFDYYTEAEAEVEVRTTAEDVRAEFGAFASAGYCARNASSAAFTAVASWSPTAILAMLKNEIYRGDLALMYFPTLDVATGRLLRLAMTPPRVCPARSAPNASASGASSDSHTTA